MHLRARRVARDEGVVRDPQPVIRPDPSVAEDDADRLESEAVERRDPPDRQEDLVARHVAAVREADAVGAPGPGPGLHGDRLDTQPDVHAVPGQPGRQGRAVPGVVLRVEAPAGHDRRRHAVAGVDLGELDAARAGPQDDEAARQVLRARRLAVRPAATPSRPGRSGTAPWVPTATTRNRPRSARSPPSASRTRTDPGPATRASPRTTSAPASASRERGRRRWGRGSPRG